MDRFIRQITEHFIARLPETEDSYRIKDLEECDFPPFLVDRIHIELQWNLDESMVLPQTDWANIQSVAVQKAWQNFLDAIHAEVKLPRSYAKAVIESAVADIVEMLVQPLKNIPEILFGGEKVLTAEELDERMELLVVYPHFARVLAGYMQRKNKVELRRDHCKKIIARVDQKVTHEYTPLQWAQMLDPLFTMSGTKVDSDLLRLFFKDRKMERTARRLDTKDANISRAEFIEVLSAPELLDEEPSEQEPPKKEEGKKQGIEKKEEMIPDLPGTPKFKERKGDRENEGKTAETSDQEKPSSINYEAEMEKIEVRNESEEPEVQKEKDVENEPEAIRPEPDFEMIPDQPEIPEQNEPTSLNDVFTDDEETADRDQRDLPDYPADENIDQFAEPDSPIWMRYMDSDEEAPENETGKDIKASKTEAPDANHAKSGTKIHQRDLAHLLADDKPYFVDALFGGSEEAYEQSLKEIARKDSWKAASTLIRLNIFDRNNVNIYSEAAVDFTDRLQTYFLNKQNRNQ